MDIAVQVRHWRSPVSKRAVDELRGILLRDDIPAGMIVASSVCSPAARRAAAEFGGRPIRIIGVNRLCESLKALGLYPDDRFFSVIEHLTLGCAPGTPTRRKLASGTASTLAIAEFGQPGPFHSLTLALLAALALLLALWGLRQ